jgi:hypothetical protein
MRQFSRDTLNRKSLERATSIISKKHPDLADRFGQTLKLLTQDIVSYPNQETAWTYSKLNRNGSPLEFTFSSLNDEIRYTVEVGGPDVLPAERLQYVAQLLTVLGSEEPFIEIADSFQEVQKKGTLRWGAWLGVRHQLAGNQYKIYAEVPSDSSDRAQEIVDRYLGAMPALLGDRDARLVALGQTPGSSRCEFYFRVSGLGLSQAEIDGLLFQLDLQHRQQELLELMQAIQISSSEQSQLPEVEYGLSYSVLPGKEDPVFSVFAFAPDYIGGDAFVRHQILATALSRGWSLGAYPILAETITYQFTRCIHHNVIAFILGPKNNLGLHISLSPPFPKLEI